MGIKERKAGLKRQIEMKERKLAELDSLPDFDALEEGTVLAMAITVSQNRAQTYIGLKSGGRWLLTGDNRPGGLTPEGLADWLTTGTRKLEEAQVLAIVDTGVEEAPVVDLGPMLDGLLDSIPAGHTDSYPEDDYGNGRW